MKITIEVDCSPEEVRRLLSLPDLEPLHDIYVSRAEEMVKKGVTPEVVEGLVKNWAPVGEAGLTLVQSLLGQIGGMNSHGKNKNADSADSADDDDIVFSETSRKPTRKKKR